MYSDGVGWTEVTSQRPTHNQRKPHQNAKTPYSAIKPDYSVVGRDNMIIISTICFNLTNLILSLSNTHTTTLTWENLTISQFIDAAIDYRAWTIIDGSEAN